MRVLTYNIRGGLGMDGQRDTGRIGTIVANQAPDIVCFQEVHQRLPWSGWVDQPRRLHASLGMEFIFQANLRVGFGGYGVGVATKYPVMTVNHHFLPSIGEQRGALEVRLDTPQGPLTVFCTHWGLKAEERLRQATQMAAWINAAPRPLIVCGDLNETPATSTVQEFLTATGLCDADAEANRPTYPSETPRARIDVIFYSPDLRPQNVSVIGTDASDHLPLQADFH